MLADSHCHLDFEAFESDREEVIERARAAGVKRMVSICTRMKDFPAILKIAEKHEDIFCTAGVHPNETAEHRDLSVESLVTLAESGRVAAFGETGLDFYRSMESRKEQERLFRIHIEAARETGLPVVIHSRAADEAMIALLREEYKKGAFSAVMHCFSSGADLARAALDLGFYLSFSGILTFRKAEAVRQAAKDAPADRLLVETDAPYLAPEPKRGKRNEPAFVGYTARRLGEVRGIEEEEAVSLTGENFLRLFSRAGGA